MKRRAILIPTLLIGLGVGGLTVTQAFASTDRAASNSTPSTTVSSWNGYSDMMGGYFAGSQTGANRSNGNNWSSMMGQVFNGNGSTDWSGAMGSMMGQTFGQVSTLDASKAVSEMDASLKNASLDKATNTITYSGQTVKIVVLGGAMDSSTSGPDEKFVIGGLVNPTLHVEKGAKVTFELINEDTGMPHGVEVTQAAPPYGVMSMMQGGTYPGAFIAPIPAATNDSYPVATTTFNANTAGAFNYICEYPGHAAEGMYGKIIVG